LCFFAWGEIFSLFPSITGDLFGKTWATPNYGIVYTAKGMGALFAGVGAAWLFEKTGSWTKVFWAMIACDLIAALLALFWLKPVAARTIEQSNRMAPAVNINAPLKVRGVA
jgi:sugar phosphate permease